MTAHPLFGLLLATFGALVLTPDTLFMRWSGLDGTEMLVWRGMLAGPVFLLIWLVTSRSHRTDLRRLITWAGLGVFLCQFFNATLFPTAIGLAPVSVVLFAVATVPIFSAIFGRMISGEIPSNETWITIAIVLFGVGLAVFGHGGQVALDLSTILGALAGFGVAIALALNFALIRHHRDVPFVLAIGLGALTAGTMALTLVGPTRALDGNIAAIAFTGAVILPVSFFTLSLASRYTAAANVSLLMLLETVLGPVWVWLGTDERPTTLTLIGGAIVVASLARYILRSRKRGRELPVG